MKTHPVQNHIHIAPGVNHGCLAAQLQHFPRHADDFVLEGLEVLGEDAWGLRVVHFLLS